MLVLAAVAWRTMLSMPGSAWRGALPSQSAEQRALAEELRRDVTAITANGPRTVPQSLAPAADYIERELRAAGYAPQRQHTSEGDNIDVEVKGSSNELVIIGAHYDSVDEAPGADDNASGVAGTLAMARRLVHEKPRCSLRFVFFAAEEPPNFKQGTMGSYQYAKRCHERHEVVRAMLSIESIGYYDARPRSQLYPPALAPFFPSTERRIAAPDECASDLAVAAARRLFETGVCSPEQIDYLILCTQSPDWFLPTTACLVQEKLGLAMDCGAIDINQGCSGFVYGLSLAKGLIESGSAQRVLLITADTYSKFINRRDRSVRTLFGDGAAATLVGGVEAEGAEHLGPFVFGTDGRGAANLIVPAGGLRRRGDAAIEEYEDKSGNWRSERDLFMNGPEIFNFTLKIVPRTVDAILEKSALKREDVDLWVFHQANRFMLEKLRTKLGIPPERFPLQMEYCGNVVSSTIPITLQKAKEEGHLRSGSRVALVGFGVGYSWAAAMMRPL